VSRIVITVPPSPRLPDMRLADALVLKTVGIRETESAEVDAVK